MTSFRIALTGILLALAGCAAIPAPVPGGAAAVELGRESPFRRGVNVLGYDPYWKDPAEARFQARHFTEIRNAGFDHVRLNLFAFGHMDADNRIDPKWLARLDTVVRQAQAAGLGVILDEHDFDTCAKDVPACRIKLPAFWSQVAPRYRHAARNVAFELLNEPHGALDAATWNAFSADLLAIVRQSNPTRIVVIGPTSWNSLRELPNLVLPESDRNLLVTFHYYDPFGFTHQGAGWTDLKELRGVSFGSAADLAQLREDFDKVAAWGAAHRRPILLGEFGAYDKSGTPEAMRTAYTAAVAREAEGHGFGWAYWQFDSDFIVYNIDKETWVKPILKALVNK